MFVPMFELSCHQCGTVGAKKVIDSPAGFHCNLLLDYKLLVNSTSSSAMERQIEQCHYSPFNCHSLGDAISDGQSWQSSKCLCHEPAPFFFLLWLVCIRKIGSASGGNVRKVFHRQGNGFLGVHITKHY